MPASSHAACKLLVFMFLIWKKEDQGLVDSQPNNLLSVKKLTLILYSDFERLS